MKGELSLSCSKMRRVRQRLFQKENRKKKEPLLDHWNLYGKLDETPAEAVKEINKHR